MERLTQRIDGYLNIWGRTALYEAVERPGAYLNNAIVRLAAYEDTGLTPEEVKLIANALREVGETYNCWFNYVAQCVIEHSKLQEFVQAEKDGRLVVLPCKVTDTVYIVESIMKGKKHIGEKVVSAQIDHVTIGGSKKPVLDVCSETGNWYIALEDGEFWITRREAEAALREADENA